MNELKITVQQPSDDSFGKSLISLLNFLQDLYLVAPGDRVVLYLNQLSFAYPFMTLPIASQINKLKQQGIFVDIEGKHSSCYDYLNAINFPLGVNPDKEKNWELLLAGYNQKTFVPICLFPTGKENPIVREQLISILETIVANRSNIGSNFRSVLSLLISEATDNIVNHAGTEYGWIMMQVFPRKQFIDLCICDTGITILGSYLKNGYYRIADDKEALNAAAKGLSTKEYAIKRGFGISKSLSLLVDGLNGKYFIFSGLAAYVNTIEFKQIITMREYQKFYGTMVAMRIPCSIPKGFNLYNYLE